MWTDRCILALRRQDEIGLTNSTNLCILPRGCRSLDSCWARCKFDVDVTLLQRNLGNVIRTERLKLGLNQEQLAERCQVHRTYIGIVERGESNISIQNVVRIANGLNMPVWKLIRAAEETTTSP